MTLQRVLALATIALAVAACQSNAPSKETSPSSGSISTPSVPNTALRRSSVSIEQAAQIFDEVCIQQAPTFSGTAAEAVENGLTRRGEHGSYRHPTGNLRVMLDGRTCVMAFSSDEDQQALERALTSLGTPSMPVDYQAIVNPPILSMEFGDVMHFVSVTAR